MCLDYLFLNERQRFVMLRESHEPKCSWETNFSKSVVPISRKVCLKFDNTSCNFVRCRGKCRNEFFHDLMAETLSRFQGTSSRSRTTFLWVWGKTRAAREGHSGWILGQTKVFIPYVGVERVTIWKGSKYAKRKTS